AKSTRAVEELSSGSKVSNPAYAPAEAAIGDILTAKLRSLGQASKTVSQANSIIQMATGTLGSSNQILQRMKELADQSNGDGVDDSQRVMLDNEYQQLISQLNLNASSTRLGKTSLFTGGAGTVTGAASAVANPTMTGGNSGGMAANTLGGFVAGSTQGYITGTAKDFTVTQNGNMYDLSLTVGDQTFTATTSPVANTNILLRSTTDSRNIIAISYNATAITGITNATTFQTAGRELFGLNTGQNAVFTSATNVTATAYANATISASSGVKAGSWALQYDVVSGTGTFSITNGVNKYTATATSSASMTSTINFDNGVSLALAAFNGSSSIAQTVFSVAQGTSVNMSFQIGDQTADTVSLSFSGATATALSVNGTNVLTKTNASTASNAIDRAQSSISSQIATLGGKKSQLDFQADTLKVAIQNNTSMKSSFVDANMAESLMDSTRYKALTEMSSTVFSQALQEPSRIARMVQQATS
ncbi:MAG: flagellin, partial [Proteobacteria bacterium]|nr:flagellin [Pseudomonadota bacterium]